MGKSYRKHKIFGCAATSSEKKDKILHHRKMRRKVKDQIQKEDFDTPFPVDNEVSNVWTWNKDGKQYWGEATEIDMGK